MGQRILVVAAHPDDEVLGCGATIMKHIAEGDIVHTMIMPEGLTSRDLTRNVEMRAGNCQSFMPLRSIQLNFQV